MNETNRRNSIICTHCGEMTKNYMALDLAEEMKERCEARVEAWIMSTKDDRNIQNALCALLQAIQCIPLPGEEDCGD